MNQRNTDYRTILVWIIRQENFPLKIAGGVEKKERDKCEENGVVIISVYNERFYNFILQFSPGIKHLKIL